MNFTEQSRCAHPSLLAHDDAGAFRFEIACMDCGEQRHLTHADWRRFVAASGPSPALLAAAHGLDSGRRSGLN